jgi:hypothetical protein
MLMLKSSISLDNLFVAFCLAVDSSGNQNILKRRRLIKKYSLWHWYSFLLLLFQLTCFRITTVMKKVVINDFI